MGTYTAHAVEGASLRVEADTSALRVTVYAPDVLRVDFLPSLQTTFDSSLVVVQEPNTGEAFTVKETDEALYLETSAVHVTISKAPVRVAFATASGESLLREPEETGMVAEETNRYTYFRLRPGEHLYGTGERGLDIDLRGERFQSFNQSIFGYTGPEPAMNINVPLVLSSAGYALYWENTYPATFDLGHTQSNRMVYEARGGELSYFFMAGEQLRDQLERYTWLTGRPPMPPKWALGYLQSKYGYRDEAEARDMVQTMRAKDIPADGIILDLYWFRQMGDLDWNRARWTDPSGMIQDFREQGIKTINISELYVTESSAHFSQATGNPLLVGKTPDGNPYRVSNWFSCGCDAVLLDLTNPATRDWFWQQYVEFMDAGVAGLWTDIGEPEVHPLNMVHANGTARSVHNVYNLIWARTVYKGFSDLRPNRRLFNLTRSGYAGIQRYGVFTWSADVGRSFGGLSVQLPILLNTSLSGLGFHSSDLGGFVGQTSPELYMRWIQFGALNPVMRAHGVDNHPTEPWGFGATAETVARDYIRMRYRLLPYLYTLAEEYHRTGMPLARPLLFADPRNPLLADEDRAFLLGENMLVAPVMQRGTRPKTILLPDGRWVNYDTDEVYDGGRTITLDAPLTRMPVLVRAGALLPKQPVMDYVGQRPVDTLTVAVYPDREAARPFTLYEDDGLTREYEEGAFARTTFHHQLTEMGDQSTLVVERSATDGSYQGQPDTRTLLADIHLAAEAPRRVTVDGTPVPERASLQALRESGAGYFYDWLEARLWVQAPGSIRDARRIEVQPFAVGAPELHPDGVIEELLANYPNPFHTQTTLSYTTTTSAHVQLNVYDVLGRRVATLVDERQPPGLHGVRFRPAEEGLSLASGTYFYRLRVTGTNGSMFEDVRQMVYVRP